MKALIKKKESRIVQGGSNMTGTYAACLHTNQSRSYLNHLVPCCSLVNTETPVNFQQNLHESTYYRNFDV